MTDKISSFNFLLLIKGVGDRIFLECRLVGPSANHEDTSLPDGELMIDRQVLKILKIRKPEHAFACCVTLWKPF